MTCDDLIRGITIAAFAPTPGELIFLLLFEHGKAPDIGEITFTASISGNR
jgi:hypothetical protein